LQRRRKAGGASSKFLRAQNDKISAARDIGPRNRSGRRETSMMQRSKYRAGGLLGIEIPYKSEENCFWLVYVRSYGQ
jgi:hypothetical protein